MRSAWISLLSVLLFAFVAEALVRVGKPDLSFPREDLRFRFDPLGHQGQIYHERDAVLGWRLKAKSRVAMGVGETGQKVLTTNSHGFRGPEFDEKKPDGVIRVVFAGDSNAMGYGVSDEATYATGVAALLPRLLPEGSKRVETINLGVDGYSSHQVRLLLEEYVPKLQPDLVCVQVGFNDHCIADMPDSSRVFRRPAALGAAEKSHAYRWLRRRILAVRDHPAPLSEPVPRVGIEAFERNLRSIVETCRRSGARPLLVATAPRPDAPLVINEVPFQGDSAIVWMTQQRWIDEQLRRAGVVGTDPTKDPAYERTLRAVIAVGPEFPLPYFALWSYLRQSAAPDSAELAALEHRWRSLDRERAFLGEYMESVRELCRREVIDFLDVAWVVAQHPGTRPGDLYLDFVHLNEAGQIAMARALTPILARGIRNDS